MDTALWSRLASARVYDLEQPRVFGMPIFPSHKPGYFYALHRRHRDSYQPAVHGPRSGASGMLTMMEHTGTHIDALCHQACELTLFGGTPADKVETPAGFTELGAETIPPLVGRGVLLDVPGSMGLTILAPGYEISSGQLAECAQREGVEVRPGDVLLVRTGYGAIWPDEAKYLGPPASPRAARCGRPNGEWWPSGPTTWPGTYPASKTPRRAPRCLATSICYRRRGSTSSRT